MSYKKTCDFLLVPWEYRENNNKLMFLRFCGTRSRETRGESILELFPTIPTYQNRTNINSRLVLCKVSGIFVFSVFCPIGPLLYPYWTPFVENLDTIGDDIVDNEAVAASSPQSPAKETQENSKEDEKDSKSAQETKQNEKESKEDESKEDENKDRDGSGPGL